jgi:hypothetical protein
MRTLRSFSCFILAAALLCVASSAADAQLKTSFQYAVKTLCSLRGDFGSALAPGQYRTLINIHNPTEKKNEVARKFALSGSPGDTGGGISITPYKSFVLGPDQAVAINCFEIANFFCPINGICVDFIAIDGFLVLNSTLELDVTAVYTGNPKAGEISALEIETIAARKIAKIIPIKGDEPKTDKRIEVPPFKAINP